MTSISGLKRLIIALKLRLCLFWVKSISGNAFTFLRVFGCTRKMHFPEMLFSWPLNGCKLISVSILPSNRNFPENRERVEGEEDAPARREREREREREEEERGDDRFAVRFRIRSTSQTQITNPDREPRSWTPRESRSRTPIANPDRSTDSSSPIANRDPSHPKTDRPPSLLLWIWSDYDFFFPGFYLCFCVILIFVVVVVFWWLWLLIAGVCCCGLNCRVKFF